MNESADRNNGPDTADQYEIVAATRHWLEVAVIGLNLCPFAKAVHVKQQIRYAVTQASSEGELLAVLRDELSLLAKADSNEIDTTLLIHPQALTDFIDYTAFLRKADRLLRSQGHEGTLQIASFHPAYEFAGSSPDAAPAARRQYRACGRRLSGCRRDLRAQHRDAAAPRAHRMATAVHAGSRLTRAQAAQLAMSQLAMSQSALTQ